MTAGNRGKHRRGPKPSGPRWRNPEFGAWVAEGLKEHLEPCPADAGRYTRSVYDTILTLGGGELNFNAIARATKIQNKILIKKIRAMEATGVLYPCEGKYHIADSGERDAWRAVGQYLQELHEDLVLKLRRAFPDGWDEPEPGEAASALKALIHAIGIDFLHRDRPIPRPEIHETIHRGLEPVWLEAERAELEALLAPLDQEWKCMIEKGGEAGIEPRNLLDYQRRRDRVVDEFRVSHPRS